MRRQGLEALRRRGTIRSPEDDDIVLLGPWRAQVSDVDDPKKLGRVKVVIPEVTGNAEHGKWAWPVGAPMGGGKISGASFGSLFVPPQGAWVWVEFLDGNRDEIAYSPGWLGEDELPDVLKTNYPKRRGLVTPSGHALYLDDATDGDGQGDVELAQRDGASLLLAGDGSATLADKNGAQLELDGDANLDPKNGGKVNLAGGLPGADLKAGARKGDSVDRNATLATWMSQVEAVCNTISEGAVTPLLSPTIATISGGSANVNLN